MKSISHIFCRTFIVFILFSFLAVSFINAQVPAFPGAEGFGANTPGGRGGTVYKVTNLNESGTGSLKEALEASGPRIVVFETGGFIPLTDRIRITSPYLTIAGQTATSDGICTKGAPISIRTHDVIVCGIRIRTGDEDNGFETNRNGLQIGTSSETCYNIIVDHMSISWGIDEEAQHMV